MTLKSKRLFFATAFLAICIFNSSCSTSPNSNGSSDDDEQQTNPPDGRGGGVIAFSITPANDNNEIYIMNADGTNQQRLTHTNVHAIQPDWRPLQN